MEMAATATAMDIITINQLTIRQAMETEMVTVTDSTATQAVDHKMTSSHRTIHQTMHTYLHKLINLKPSHQDPTINTFHHHKIKIAQMEMATVTSIHNPDIDTEVRAFRKKPIPSYPVHNHPFTNWFARINHKWRNYSFRLRFNPQTRYHTY